MLDHEAQHCVNYDNNPQKFSNDLKTKDNNYGSIEAAFQSRFFSKR